MSLPSQNPRTYKMHHHHHHHHHQVNVHLRHIPVAKNDLANGPAARTLNLTPTQRVVKIGRASKSPDKGLQGATDNAWFDSPVMSRNHAEIIYSPSEMNIQIRDVGSMHGTFVNGERLGGDIKPLNLNDEIAFGVGVRRGTEMFPACHFSVAYDLIPWKKSNSYAVPDSSDEEDEDYNCSEEGSRSARTSSGDGASTDKMEICRSIPTVSKSIEAIDLTLYDTPSPRIDATESSSILTAKKTQEDHVPKSPVLAYCSPPDVSTDRRSIMADDGSTLSDSHKRGKENDRLSNSIYENDDEDEGIPSPYDSGMSVSSAPCAKAFHSDVSGLSSIHEDFDSDRSRLSSVHAEDLDSDGSVLSSVHVKDFDDNGDEESKYPEAAPGAARRLEGGILVTTDRVIFSEIRSSPFCSPYVSRGSSPVPPVTTSRPPFDNADIPESHVRTKIDTSKEVLGVGGDDGDENEEEDASVGLSEAANEGLQTLIKDGLLENKPVNPSFSSSRPNNSATWYTNTFPPSTKHELLPHHPIPSWPFERAVSPSAVAMVKAPTLSNAAETLNDQSFDINASFKSRFKALGDKTGKHAFFEAREGNKMKFQAHVDEYESVSNDRRSESPRPSFTRPTRGVGLSQPLNYFVQTTQPMGYDGNGFNHGSTKAKINHQAALSHPYLVESVEERPSIHPYYFSSDASSKAPESPALERYPVRSGLRINDIIDESSTAKTSKRKADEISEDDNLGENLNILADDVRKNEVRNWASSVENFNKVTTEPEAISEVAHQLSTIKVVPSVLATSEARPTKRLKMKKFAEAVGYFALGGAAVGAGLFSALVATAPDFL